MGELRVVSHGGGVQTTAMLVLAAQRKIDYTTFLFANVGDDSEHPATLRYLREIAQPYATAHGITIHELPATRRNGEVKTIRTTIMDTASDVIPVRLDNGAPSSRSCTRDFKIRTLGKWLKAHGASEDHPATVAVGISLDEVGRANGAKHEKYERLVYPLLCLGDESLPRPLRRHDCQRIIREAGLPVPGKSACYFCPFHRPAEWVRMARDEPSLFEQAAQVEDRLLARKAERGLHLVYLSGAMIPLRDAFAHADALDTLPGMDADPHCDNGWCMT